jgi:hemerythrin-like domain-containing protein
MSGPCLCSGRDDEPRLRDEHSFLERQLEEAIALAEADDWQGFELKWEAFMSALEQHLKYEENQIFPAFAKSSAAANLEVKQLRTAHASIREEVKFLDGETQLPDLFIEQLQYLVQVLHTHKDQEEHVLYPWLSSLQPAITSPETKLVDICDSAKTPEDLWWGNPLRHEQETARSNR